MENHREQWHEAEMLSIALVVLAQSPQAWRLTWRAPEGCTSTEQLQRALETRLGQPIFGEPAGSFIEGEVVAAATGFTAKVTVTDAKGTALGQREVTSDDASCPAIDSRLVFVLSFLVDPSGQLRAGGVRSTPAPTPTLPAVRAPARLLSPEDLVTLRVEGPVEDARVVEQRQGRTSGRDGQAWSGTIERCRPPCGVPVRRGATLEIGGGDVLPAMFTLGNVKTERAVATVVPASASRLAWSIVGVSLSTTFLGLGVVGLVLGGGSTGGAALSVASLLVGLALGGTGVWGLSQGPTRVTVREE